ncbi:MAG: Uma2 family endonuclease [Gemmatimonadota bacterium]
MIGQTRATTERRLTIEEFERLPERELRTELVRGRVVREPPAAGDHGHLCADVAYHLKRYTEEHGGGIVFGAETGFVLFEDPPTVRAPDAAFVAAERAPPRELRTGFWRLAPDLAVEIVSPSSTRAEMEAKVSDYLEAGTRLVWILDQRARTVTVHRPGEEIRLLTGTQVLDGGDILAGFRLPLPDLFGSSL